MTKHFISHLLEEHRRIEGILNELESLLDAHKSAGSWTAAHSETFARILVFFGTDLVCHIRKEEEVLFPFLRSFLPADSGPLTVLHGEHEDLCRNFTAMCRAGQSLSVQDQTAQRPADGLAEVFQRYGRTTIQLMRDHIYKEDRVLFPLMAASLRPDLDQALLQRVQTIGAWRDEPAPSAGVAEERRGGLQATGPPLA